MRPDYVGMTSLTTVNIFGGTCGMRGGNRKSWSGRRETRRNAESTGGRLDLDNGSSVDHKK